MSSISSINSFLPSSLAFAGDNKDIFSGHKREKKIAITITASSIKVKFCKDIFVGAKI